MIPAIDTFIRAIPEDDVEQSEDRRPEAENLAKKNASFFRYWQSAGMGFLDRWQRKARFSST